MAREKWEEEGSEESMRAESEASRAEDLEKAAGSSMHEEGEGSSWERKGEEVRSSMQSEGGIAHLQQYLRGVNYPAAKQDMIEAARSNSAPESVMTLMNQLPDKTYNAPKDVEEEFGKIK